MQCKNALQAKKGFLIKSDGSVNMSESEEQTTINRMTEI